MFRNIITSKFFALFSLLMISGWAHLVGSAVDDFNRSSLSSWGIGIQLFAYLLGFIGVLFNFSNSIDLLKKSWLFVVFLALACTSLLWSMDVFFTGSRLIGAIGVVAIALLIASRFSVSEFLQWMVWFFLLLVIINYAVIYFFPEVSLSKAGNYSSPWQGVFFQKNHLAHAMVIFIVISYIQLLAKKIHIGAFIAVLIITVPLVYFSKSMTANIILFAGIVTASILFFYYQRNFSLYWLLLALLTAILSVYFFKNDLLSLVGKSDTLTGRTITWGVVYEQAKMMPFLGHGYGTWVDLQLVPKQHKYLISLGGHNAYLDILFWFGWSGVILFVLFVADMARKLFILLKNKYDRTQLIFFCVFFVMFMLINITESLILVRSGLTWTFFVVMLFKLNETFDEYSRG